MNETEEDNKAFVTAPDEPLFAKVDTSLLSSSRFMNRQKIKTEIKQNRTMIRRKFDKTYKQLSLQLSNINVSSIEDTNTTPLNSDLLRN